jgi:Fur family ferric uptake transcriptional regulator
MPERSTRQKRALAALLDESDRFRSAQDLFAELRRRGETMGLTTVYNQLGALAEAGEIDSVRTDVGDRLFRRCHTPDHHHHLRCRQCGRTLEIAAAPVERWAARLAAENGFTAVDHSLEIIGLCPPCSVGGGPTDASPSP